jgi:ADP-ribosylglycohydrolase
MNKTAYKNKIASVLGGMALGESLSWVTPFSRSQAMPQWLSRIRNEIGAENYTKNLTSMPLPFALNQNSKPLQIQAADLTEWAVWTGKLLLENQGVLNQDILNSEWKALAESEAPVRGRLSIRAALRNIQRGMTAPQSGHFNPHYFDDGALPRAAIIGAFYVAKPQIAAEIAGLDTAYTHFEDGVYSSQALAAAIAEAIQGAEPQSIIEKALHTFPENSLGFRQLRKALALAEKSQGNPLHLALSLGNELFSLEYSYGNVAHDILAASLAILKICKGDFNQSLMAAALIPRAGSGLMAVMGALAGAVSGIPAELLSQIPPLEGHFVPAVKGLALSELAEKLALHFTKDSL